MANDLRRRMDSANVWLHSGVPTTPTKPSAKPEETRPLKNVPLPNTSTDQTPNWNLGPYAKSDDVRYFKSDIGEGWVEQIVPRRRTKEGSPRNDKYVLNSNGMRFRSTTEARRFLKLNDPSIKEDVSEEEEEEEESVDDEEYSRDGPQSVSYHDSDGERFMPRRDREMDGHTCNCKKTKCLKLYCECFNKDRYCTDLCSCTSCRNQPGFEAQRNEAIAEIKERNPVAFKPKLKTTTVCTCKRSRCLKKYCECFLNKVYCGSACRCLDCENVDPVHAAGPQKESAGGPRQWAQNYHPEEELTSDSQQSPHSDSDDSYKEKVPAKKKASSRSGKKSGSSSRKKSGFVEKLYNFVSFVDSVDKSVVKWMPGGESFFVENTDDLGPYLEQFFRHKNYSSLTRSMYNYGFLRHANGR